MTTEDPWLKYPAHERQWAIEQALSVPDLPMAIGAVGARWLLSVLHGTDEPHWRTDRGL